MRFRRRSKRVNRRPFDESQLPPQEFHTVLEATEEGLLLTEYASRMWVKNRYIMGVLAGNEPWDLRRGRKIAREVLDALAREAETYAENLTQTITKFRINPNSERDAQGYSHDDLENIEHRRDVSREVALRLKKQADDDTFLNELVDTSRRDAWREVAANIERNLDIESLPVDADYGRERTHRMHLLVTEDLAALQSASAGPAGSTVTSTQ